MRYLLRSLIGLMLFGVLAQAQAQPLTRSTYDDMIRVAEEQLDASRPYNALEWFKKAYEEEPSPALAYRMAELNFELRDYKKAVSYFKRAMRKAADGEMVEGLFYLGRAEKMQGNYGDALDAFREFKLMAPGHPFTERANIEVEGAQMAIKMVEPPRIKVENAGRAINSSNQEYSPVLAADGNLYYAGFGKNGYIKEEGDDAQSIRIYKAKAGGDGSYSKGTPLPKAINRAGYQTVNVAIDPQGDVMLFVRSELDGTIELESKIYYAVKGASGNFSKATLVTGLNGNYIAKHPAFGELYGKEVVFFTSDMDGGHGGQDLYYATKKGEGDYDSPINLGPDINTPYDDVTPFYNDGTLYFSTEGRPSLGGFDVYRSDWTGDKWSEPVNMGKGFNSSLDDRYFQLDKSGKNGVVASNRPPTRSVKSKTCCDDVFLLNVEPILIDLLALTLDGDGQLLEGVTVDLIQLSDGDSTVLSRKLNPEGNRFDFELVDDVSYVVVAKRDGYTDAKVELNTLGVTEPMSIEKTLVLTKEVVDEPTSTTPGEETIEITLNQPIRLANIYYDFDDDKILPASEPDLTYILNLMQEYPEMVVELGSHTDAQGKDSYNEGLSQRRAQSAVNWILQRGIDRNRLVAKGYGETNILNQCTNGVRCTDDEHRFNRRTEFKILEGPQTIQVKKLTKTRQLPSRNSLPQAVSVDTLPQKKKTILRPHKIGKVQKLKKATVKSVDISQKKKSAINELSSLYYEKDLEGVPVLQFNDRNIEFGTVKKGEKREHRYTFRNVGYTPASIAIVSACECTTLDWTRGEIGPGETGFINAIFDSSDKDAGEMIVIDIILDQLVSNGNGIIEQVQYTFELEE